MKPLGFFKCLMEHVLKCKSLKKEVMEECFNKEYLHLINSNNKVCGRNILNTYCEYIGELLFYYYSLL